MNKQLSDNCHCEGAKRLLRPSLRGTKCRSNLNDGLAMTVVRQPHKQAQATLEFTLGFVVTLLFIVLTANVFVWLNHCMVRRQVEYETTRTEAGSTDVGKSVFFERPNLNLFKLGGRE